MLHFSQQMPVCGVVESLGNRGAPSSTRSLRPLVTTDDNTVQIGAKRPPGNPTLTPKSNNFKLENSHQGKNLPTNLRLLFSGGFFTAPVGGYSERSSSIFCSISWEGPSLFIRPRNTRRKRNTNRTKRRDWRNVAISRTADVRQLLPQQECRGVDDWQPLGENFSGFLFRVYKSFFFF